MYKRQVLYVGILVAFSIPLGFYISKVMDGEKTLVSRVLGPVERGIYKLLRIDPEEDMGWKSIWPPRSSLIYSAL